MFKNIFPAKPHHFKFTTTPLIVLLGVMSLHFAAQMPSGPAIHVLIICPVPYTMLKHCSCFPHVAHRVWGLYNILNVALSCGHGWAPILCIFLNKLR